MVIVLVGNKSDLVDKREVDEEEGRDLAEKEGLCFMETSALENVNVEEAYLEMVTKIFEITSHKNVQEKINTDRESTKISVGKPIVNIDEVSATIKQSRCC
ncbi:hypothetical protein MKW94_011927 [Papaver nudicaule]|uniref:Uncharacterized protein n=1 Tax=Papaver nudicaule TaxID=74823 RepID=A0AA41VP96_PAPNU|nr:hypothetical protein [Papaver nudicaule]